ncbi:MAG: aspartyl-tRNA(Asn)/glutamyl-tRNA(Gln) amidotransferase subunit [Betaproteobacteria bacterium]|jgi:aspartyl-tRNA(Asn)/glutamyl-tRNA(Gln) amidotransferase subunit A|nr:aspartyl-tRNA(Asn)/glutamyl-tRNA(Gln) amidotransferase subunit [Betaproteobacteria bacterium]
MQPDSAKALSAAYASGKLSPVEATRACLKRIDAWEPKLNAMYRLDRDGALEQARAAEARWKAGTPRSPLDGVPITIKENIHTRGDPAPIGTRANEDLPPQKDDAPAAARVREAGCVILGKTTMPDYGMLSSGLSSMHGVTRNPWSLARNPSGSSSGAGAAAAAGYAPLHLGTDIGGSVRLPATHCGIFALKPSLGRVPVHPPYLGRVVGPMTRSVADAALLMNVIARPDARDFMSLPAAQQDFSLEDSSPRALKIGFLPDMGVGLAVNPEVRAAAEAAAAALAGAGCAVESIRSFLSEEMLDGMCRFFEARSYNDLMQLPAARRAKVLPFVAEWCSWRAAGFSGRDVMQAYALVMAMREAAVAATEPYDFLLSPTSPIVAYEAELPAPGNDAHDALPHIAFTVPWNMSEQPAASVNWSWSAEGLPIGVQLVGKRFDDQGVLRLARLVERIRPAQRPWPVTPSSSADRD